ncbi:C40 family peptidase [Botryobacter ruber]|uniref:C40 family peptidase n=1 Tax=Botryobacter ruber TaxID=2171629 RepID=UPI000E0B8694|nr:C40 family peptidase [Botryobacter ruber]
MIKSITLSVFALISLALSYFYEVIPAADTSAATAAAAAPAASFSGADMVNTLQLRLPPEEAPDALTATDSLFYERYSQKLGLNLDYSEDRKLLKTVTAWLGTPYRYGSSSKKKGTDCSGFVSSIYREVYGINLTHSSHSMFQQVERVRKDSIRTGDIVFFRRSPKQPIFHVGIYLKGNKFIHSASKGGVRISSLKEPFYNRNYFAAGRVN